jgi:hypothetical protein
MVAMVAAIVVAVTAIGWWWCCDLEPLVAAELGVFILAPEALLLQIVTEPADRVDVLLPLLDLVD